MRTALRNSFALLAVLIFAPSVSAAPIVNDRSDPVNILPGPEVPVQTIFNNLFGAANAPNVMTDQSNLATFRPTAATVFTFLDGHAGYRSTNIFGIYAVGRDAEQIVFNGYVPNGAEVVGLFSSSAQMTDFGLFLDVAANGGYRLFSDDSLNPQGVAQMVVYFGEGQAFLNSQLGYDGIFGPNDIIVVIEDLRRWIPGGSDDDFNDLVILIENLNPGQPLPADPDFEIRLPEPGSIALWTLLGAIGGLSAWRRRPK
jgi:hypothetical protein